MTQNIYDNESFFSGYSRLPRSVEGLDGAPEWPTLRAMLPEVSGRRAVDLGFSFEDIAELAGLKGGLQTCNDVYQIVERHRASLRRRIDEFTQMETALKALVDICPKKGSRSDCEILAELSRPIEC